MDYYKLLGVKPTASKSEIKKAYRELAKKYHPDTGRTDEKSRKRFEEITRAYKVLSDDEERKRYNRYGHTDYVRFAGRNKDFQDFNEDFEDYYAHADEECDGSCGGECGGECGGDHHHEHGHGHGHGHDHCGCGEAGIGPGFGKDAPPPKTQRTSVWISIADTLKGCRTSCEVKIDVPCSHCEGRDTREDEFTENCRYCCGTGKVKQIRTVKVNIPERVYDNRFFMLYDILDEDEEWLDDYGRVAVLVFIRDEPGYVIKECHVHTTREVEYFDLVLGGPMTFETYDGPITVDVPAGSKNGIRLCVQGRGLWMPAKVGNRGDLLITLMVKIPKNLTKKQKAALLAFKKAMSEA